MVEERPKAFTLQSRDATTYQGEPVCPICKSGYVDILLPPEQRPHYVLAAIYCETCDDWLDMIPRRT